jgi:hypothetical protein
MGSLLTAIKSRLLPALLTAAGATLVTAGLLSLAPAIGQTGGEPSAAPSATASVLAPSAATSTPSVEPSPTADRSPRTATRVAIPALRIDLPVVRPPRDANAYPWCDVAMFIRELGQPGEGRAIYFYAHAREGMFLPILEASQRNNGRRMIGLLVQVWTSDNRLYTYEISEVRRHQTDLRDAQRATSEELWLQTSEGPRGTIPKTQVIAKPLAAPLPADPRDAHPRARPVDCD